MTKRAMLLVLLLANATPVAAQTLEKVEGRVKKLESEMRAVQRKVFPGASKDYFEPEITAPAAPATAPGEPAANPLSELGQRVDSLERQMTTLTGQVEETSFRVRQLEAQLAKFKTDAEFRLTTLEGGGADGTNVALAWGYVAARVVHSLVQATRNVIPVRFAVFALGSLLLMAMLVRTLLAIA